MEKKYTILRVIATLYKIVGVLVGLGTILAVFFQIIGTAAGTTFLRQYGVDLGASGPVVVFISAVVSLIAGALTALGIFAIGEAIYVLINLEENTRFTAILLRDRFYPQQMPTAPVVPPQPVAPPPNNPTYPPPA